MSDKKNIKTKKLLNWLQNTIAKPQKKLDGQAICPFLKQYLANIQIIEVKNPKHLSTHVHTCASIMGSLGLEGIIIHGFDEKYEKLIRMAKAWNVKYAYNDTTILVMHPETIDPPLPLNYNYEDPLIIIQKTSTLEKARKQLEKNGKYYKHYK